MLVRRNGKWAIHPEVVKARKFFKDLDHQVIFELGDQLVLGAFDWVDWFDDEPSAIFMNELERLRVNYEER